MVWNKFGRPALKQEIVTGTQDYKISTKKTHWLVNMHCCSEACAPSWALLNSDMTKCGQNAVCLSKVFVIYLCSLYPTLCERVPNIFLLKYLYSFSRHSRLWNFIQVSSQVLIHMFKHQR